MSARARRSCASTRSESSSTLAADSWSSCTSRERSERAHPTRALGARRAGAVSLARITAFALDGVDSRRVWVEADIRIGLPAFTIVGLADKAVREARERVRSAITNSGFEFPQKRITINLAPAYLRKIGPGFDLPLAVAILAASGQVEAEAIANCALAGELSLTGELRAMRGALAVAEGAAAHGIGRVHGAGV